MLGFAFAGKRHSAAKVAASVFDRSGQIRRPDLRKILISFFSMGAEVAKTASGGLSVF
jgi:hypothetical protein